MKPPTIKIWKKVLTKAIWAAFTSSKTEILNKIGNLDFNPEFSSSFTMFFHPKDLKLENNNLWFIAAVCQQNLALKHFSNVLL